MRLTVFVAFCATLVAAPAFARVTLRPGVRGRVVQARPGYYAPQGK